MSTAADLPLGQRGEPALELIEPKSRCRRDVSVEAEIARAPVVPKNFVTC